MQNNAHRLGHECDQSFCCCLVNCNYCSANYCTNLCATISMVVECILLYRCHYYSIDVYLHQTLQSLYHRFTDDDGGSAACECSKFPASRSRPISTIFTDIFDVSRCSDETAVYLVRSSDDAYPLSIVTRSRFFGVGKLKFLRHPRLRLLLSSCVLSKRLRRVERCMMS